ncbi:MAG: tetratricopeptide repeat protein [Brevinema sp.]
MKKYLILFFVLFFRISSYSKYVFINSTPADASVYLLEDKPASTEKKNQTKKILGRTPLKLDVDTKQLIIVEKTGYYPVTNNIKNSLEAQNISVPLIPISFAVEFPNTEAYFCLNKKSVASLDGRMLLPYGNYNLSFDKKKNSLIVNYKSPSLPYVAFFGTITAISLVTTILSATLGAASFKKFQNATSQQEAIKFIGETATWDSVMWGSIGVGTAGLIGTAISGYYEARDRKRIKRFNDLNKPTAAINPLQEYQSIVLSASTTETNILLKKMSQFIAKYKETEHLWVGNMYLKRAQLYIESTNYNNAVDDLQKILKDYQTFENYEIANKLLADIYTLQRKFKRAFEHYQEALSIARIYSVSELKFLMLDSLYLSAKNNPKDQAEFLKLSQDTKGLSSSEKTLVKERRQEFIK